MATFGYYCVAVASVSARISEEADVAVDAMSVRDGRQKVDIVSAGAWVLAVLPKTIADALVLEMTRGVADHESRLRALEAAMRTYLDSRPSGDPVAGIDPAARTPAPSAQQAASRTGTHGERPSRGKRPGVKKAQ